MMSDEERDGGEVGSSSPKGTLFLTNYFSDVMIVHKYSFASFVIL